MLQIQMALVMPISHALLSRAQTLENYILFILTRKPWRSARWLEQFLPTVQLIPANSTTEALQQLEQDWTVGAISSLRVPTYNLPC